VIREGKVVSPTIVIILKVGEAINIKILDGIKIIVHPICKVLFQQQQPLYPLDTEKLNKSEDTSEKFMKAIMASHENNMATTINIDVYVRNDCLNKRGVELFYQRFSQILAS